MGGVYHRHHDTSCGLPRTGLRLICIDTLPSATHRASDRLTSCEEVATQSQEVRLDARPGAYQDSAKSRVIAQLHQCAQELICGQRSGCA